MGKGYYVGLDMGTGSVGWAVTDESYQILRRHGKAMWGVRLFESAKTAEERYRGKDHIIERMEDRDFAGDFCRRDQPG